MKEYPDCMTCKNVRIIMPFGDAKCAEKSGNNHCEIMASEDGETVIGGKTLSSGKISPCSKWKVRKGEIEVVDNPEYGYSGLDEGMRGIK